LFVVICCHGVPPVEYDVLQVHSWSVIIGRNEKSV
jgi:hypothetical protein